MTCAAPPPAQDDIMFTKQRSIKLVSVLLLLVGSRCDELKERDMGDESLSGDCRVLCVNLGCDDQVNVAKCNVECVERMDEALEVDAGCGSSYGEMLACLGELHDCGEGWTWNMLRYGDLEYPCRPETEAFEVACPAVWPKP